MPKKQYLCSDCKNPMFLIHEEITVTNEHGSFPYELWGCNICKTETEVTQTPIGQPVIGQSQDVFI